MKCMNCGAQIPDDRLICPRCGREIQIVPDYNPLDDVLAAQVKGAVTESFDPVGHARDGRRSTSERTSAGQVSSGKANPRRNTGKGRSGNLTPEELRERKKRIERKKQIAKKKKIRKRIILFSGVILALIVGVIVYLNSYTGKVNKGYRMLENGKYKEALLCFEKAVSKNEKRGEAYEGLAKVYLAQNDTESGEKVFLNAIKEQPSNTEIYQKAIQFYIDTDQKMKVSVLLDQCTSEQVLSACSDYISEEPEYSLDEMKEYEEIQALELTGTGTAIYYTTDGTDPTQNSLKYTEPIRLDEGVTEIRAISVNEKGIPSLVARKTYTIEFPIEDAPSVTPSTGSYDTVQSIEIVVPENYEGYYTTEGSDPDPSSSTTVKYTGPITMPEGSITFKAVLVNKKGRISDVTIRKYELILSE